MPVFPEVRSEVLRNGTSNTGTPEQTLKHSDNKITYTGFGYYRRPPEAGPEWSEIHLRSHIEELGPAAEKCGLFEMAGLEPKKMAGLEPKRADV